jgi:hypothetical protein
MVTYLRSPLLNKKLPPGKREFEYLPAGQILALLHFLMLFNYFYVKRRALIYYSIPCVPVFRIVLNINMTINFLVLIQT